MKKTLKLFIFLMISLLVMVACGNDDTSTKNNENENNKSTSETDQTENNDADEGADQEDVENDNADSANSETDDEVPVLALGETGVIEDTLGTYEITPNSFVFAEELRDGEEVSTPSNDIFVVIDLEIKNIGSETLDLEDITQTDLFTETGSAKPGSSNYPGLIEFTGEIKPGEKFRGQLAYDTPKRDYYELAFGFGMPSYISNEIRWVINPEDAE